MQNFNQSRDVFYVSDATAITCETLGHAVLGQFPFEANIHTFPFVESEEKLNELLKHIELSFQKNAVRPLVFFSIVIPEIKDKLLMSNGYFYDVLAHLVDSVQKDLNLEAKPRLQRSHGFDNNTDSYFDRISAVEYTLAHDDGISLKGLEKADIILLGVSRSGKTPTSLYMAMQFGLRVVNYPFIAEDIERLRLLPEFDIYRHKLFGLTINPERLTEIRNNRLANSEYASSEQCATELIKVETLFRREAIPYINTSHMSVEEISTRIMELTGLKRQTF